jgi:flagellar protein FliO/FliZ
MNTGLGFADALQYLLSFALVIGLLLATLWGLRKMQSGAPFLRKNSQRLHTIESLSIGTRQKVVLIQVDGQNLLIGVTPHQITALTVWPSSSANTACSASSAPSDTPTSADLLAKWAMQTSPKPDNTP